MNFIKAVRRLWSPGLALALACGAAWPALGDPVNLSYGMASYSFTYAPLYIAEDAGFFQKEGVNVKGVLMSGSGVEAAATIAGNLAFYIGLAQTAALANAKGRKLSVFAEITQQFPEDIVVSKAVAQRLKLTEDMPVDKRLDALKGLKIAAWSPGATPDLMLRFIVAKKGWSAQRDLTILPIGPAAAMIAALQNDRIDGFVFSSPSSDEAVRRLGAFIVYRGAVPAWGPLKDAVFNCLIANANWLDANKAAGASIYRALQQAMNFMRTDPQAARAMLRKRMAGFNDADFEAGYQNLHYLIPQSPEVGATQQAQVEDFMKAIDPSFDTPAAQLTDPEIGLIASKPAAPH